MEWSAGGSGWRGLLCVRTAAGSWNKKLCALPIWYRLDIKVARAWRETTPVCSGLTRLVRARYSHPDSGASRERARITRHAQDGSIHMQCSLPSRSTLRVWVTNLFSKNNNWEAWPYMPLPKNVWWFEIWAKIGQSALKFPGKCFRGEVLALLGGHSNLGFGQKWAKIVCAPPPPKKKEEHIPYAYEMWTCVTSSVVT